MAWRHLKRLHFYNFTFCIVHCQCWGASYRANFVRDCKLTITFWSKFQLFCEVRGIQNGTPRVLYINRRENHTQQRRGLKKSWEERKLQFSDSEIQYEKVSRSFTLNSHVIIYTPRSSKKTVQNCFCQNFVKFPPNLVIFGTQVVTVRCTHFPLHLISVNTLPC